MDKAVLSGEQWLALGIFALTYAAIVSERVHRTVAAGVGAALVVVTGLLSQQEALSTLDLGTLGLLFGMMVQVSVLQRSGFFESVASRVARLAGGRPFVLLVLLAAATAVFSAGLDNVTTVLVMAPIALSLSRASGANPVPYLLAVVFASNVGGAATLVGDPPNILIGMAAGIPFDEFVRNLGPVCAVAFGATLLYLHGALKRRLGPAAVAPAGSATVPNETRDPRLLAPSVAVVALTLACFALHGVIHVELATVAVAGAAVLLVVTRADVGSVLAEVEWATLLLFTGLFVVVGALDKTGLLRLVASRAFEWTGGDPKLTAFAVLWLAAILSAVVDNIPFVVTMIPFVSEIARLMHPHAGLGDAVLLQPDVMPLWWALALGACLGGNGTLFGASANLVVAGIAERAGYRISFGTFLRYGAPVSFLTILVASVWLLA